MDKYENLGLVGEGSYGMVLRCKHKESGQLVAIKKFLESEDDKMVKKIALREVKMLKQLRHDHLVNLLEVFRRKKRLYLVFEFVDHTVLDELEKCPNGLDENTVRKILYQVLKGIEFCHLHNIIHRDIKPENILVSRTGIVKLCDFGFARTLAQPGETYTDYVATRWYRAPELLVGDTKYGRAVDLWAIGCLVAEMLTGEPLFPGDSDIDQLYHIVKCFGNLPSRHKEVFLRNPLFVGMRLPEVREIQPLEKKFKRVSNLALDIMKQCLKLDPDERPQCSELIKREFFQKDGFAQKFSQDLKMRLQRATTDNPLLKSINKPDSATNENKDSSDQLKTVKKKKKTESKDKDIKEPAKDTKDKDSKDKDKESNEDKLKKKMSDSEPKNSSRKVHPPLSKEQTIILPAAPVGGVVSQPIGNQSNSTDDMSEKEKVKKEEKENEKERDKENSTSPQQPPIGVPPINMTQVIGCGTPSIPAINSPNVACATSNYVSVNNLTLSSPTLLGSLWGPASIRISDKTVKKSSSSSFKKPSPSNHHSVSISPQPLQTEKSSLYDKHTHYDGKSKKGGDKKDDKGLSFPEVKGLSLPEVKGAEAKSKEKVNKKSNISMIPHITTLDFMGSSNQHNAYDSDRDNNSLPNV
ncbi:hypothetical protein SNE40_018518 [Patella caerulea]|uniref:Cyclin-dependent kinase-like 2 n=1 Tax=Patella caerulea TaxID=87958 RepID=A0AAN8J7G4_PATCE